MGVYSKRGIPLFAAVQRMMPRACATAMPVVMLLETNSSSTAMASGRSCAISSSISRSSCTSRAASGSPAGVVTAPYCSICVFPVSASIRPKPTMASPGSMPSIRMALPSLGAERCTAACSDPRSAQYGILYQTGVQNASPCGAAAKKPPQTALRRLSCMVLTWSRPCGRPSCPCG